MLNYCNVNEPWYLCGPCNVVGQCNVVAAMIVDVVWLLASIVCCCHVIKFLQPFFTPNSYNDQGVNIIADDGGADGGANGGVGRGATAGGAAARGIDDGWTTTDGGATTKDSDDKWSTDDD